MANLRDKLRDKPPQPPTKGASKARPAKKSPKRAATKSSGSLFQGLDVNKRLLLASAGIAVLAGLIAVTYLSDAQNNAKAGWAKVKVYVPVRNLDARTQIDASMITELEVPKAILPDGAYTDKKDVVGKITLAPVVKNEVLHKVRLVEASEATGVAPKAGADEQVLPFAPSNLQELSVVKPDDYVDLTATIQANGKTISTKVLQHVHVLSVGSRFSNASPAPGADTSTNNGDMLTLAIPRSKVTLMMALRQLNALNMTLRQPGDTSTVPPEIPEAALRRMVLGGVPSEATPVRIVVPHPAAPVYHPRPQPVQPRPHPAAVVPKPKGPDIIIYKGTERVH